MTNVPQTIIFDLGKVIVDFDHMTFCRNASHHCQASPAAVYDKIFQSGLERLFDDGTLSGEAFFKAACAGLGMRADIGLFASLWSNIFTLNSGIEYLLSEVKKRFRIICLSNTNPWHFSWCRQHFKILESFDSFTLSYEEGCCKPDLEIYRRALARCQAPPSRCLYIDDIAANVDAARMLGMQGIEFVSVHKLEKELIDRGCLQHDKYDSGAPHSFQQ
jgi:putative hydrolase of the HAD superfamily